MIRNFRHAGIVVADLGQQIRFYKDLLGLEIIVESEEEPFFIQELLNVGDGRLKTVKLGIKGKVFIELLQFQEKADEHSFKKRAINLPGYTHCALTVDNIDVLHQKLLQYGLDCNSVPLQSPDGKVRLLFCRDPEGNYLELVQEGSP